MDVFIANTDKLRDYYYEKIPKDAKRSDGINMLKASDEVIMAIRGLQYLGYYLYRIWFKYIQLILDSTDIVMGAKSKVMGPILEILDISDKDKQHILTNLKPVPLINRMPNNLDILNNFINAIQKQLADTAKYQEVIEPSARDKMYREMIAFIYKKDKLETVIEDITRLKLLIPGLGKSHR